MIVRDNGARKLPHKTSLVTSDRLQNAIKDCTKVMRKLGPAHQRVKYFGHCLTQTRHMLHGQQCRAYGHTGYEVTSYFRSAFTEVRKTAENTASDGFGSNFSAAALCLPHQLVAILFFSESYSSAKVIHSLPEDNAIFGVTILNELFVFYAKLRLVGCLPISLYNKDHFSLQRTVAVPGLGGVEDVASLTTSMCLFQITPIMSYTK